MARDAERPSDEAVQRLFELSLDMLGTSEDGYFTRAEPGLGALARAGPARS